MSVRRTAIAAAATVPAYLIARKAVQALQSRSGMGKMADAGYASSGLFRNPTGQSANITDATMHLDAKTGFAMSPSDRQTLNQGVMDILLSPALAPHVAEQLARDPSYTDSQKAQADAPTRAQMYWDSLALTDAGYQIRETLVQEAYATMTGQPHPTLEKLAEIGYGASDFFPELKEAGGAGAEVEL